MGLVASKGGSMKRLIHSVSLLLLLSNAAFASDPRPLTAPVIQGAGGGRDLAYRLVAGPGMVVVHAEAVLDPESSEAELEVELLDDADQSLAAARLGQSRDKIEQAVRNAVLDLLSEIATPQPVTKRKTVRAKLDEETTLRLRVHAGAGVQQYVVKLEGPIVFEAALPAGEVQTDGVAAPETAPPAGPPTAPTGTVTTFVEEPPVEPSQPVAKIPGPSTGSVTVSAPPAGSVKIPASPASSATQPGRSIGAVRIPGHATGSVKVPVKKTPAAAPKPAPSQKASHTAKKAPPLVIRKAVGTAPHF
jgi:hypothetical protein